MKKKDVISQIENISGQMDSYLLDASIATAVKDFRDIQSEIDDLLNKLEDEGIEDDD